MYLFITIATLPSVYEQMKSDIGICEYYHGL